MKKLCITTVLCLCLVGCSFDTKYERDKERPKIINDTNDTTSKGRFKIKTGSKHNYMGDIAIIDNHEYIIVSSNVSLGISHKADCKFCIEKVK